jgi:hypothetical protein
MRLVLEAAWHSTSSALMRLVLEACYASRPLKLVLEASYATHAAYATPGGSNTIMPRAYSTLLILVGLILSIGRGAPSPPSYLSMLCALKSGDLNLKSGAP